MVTCRCRYCGQESDAPLYFPLTIQRVVNFLLDNGWSTVHDIERAVYGRTLSTNVVLNYLSFIRKEFKTRPWRLQKRRDPIHRNSNQYKIIYLPPKASADVPTNRPDCLS